MPKQTTRAQALAPHLEEIARAIQTKVDGKHEGWGSVNFIVRRAVSRLANLAGTSRTASHSATFRRAVAELNNKELPRASQRREVDGKIANIARHLGVAGPPPDKKPAKLPPPKRIKGIRRIKVNGNWLEEWGVEFGDRLLVAMTGEVRPGELGYFKLFKQYDSWDGPTSYASFFFLAEINKTCQQNEWTPQEGVCLHTFAGKCDGRHVGSEAEHVRSGYFRDCEHEDWAVPYGRVVGVERDRRAIETTLKLRPYDEREDARPSPREVARKASDEFGPDTEYIRVRLPDDELEPLYKKGEQVLVNLKTKPAPGAPGAVRVKGRGVVVGFVYDNGPQGITVNGVEEGHGTEYEAGEAEVIGEVIGPMKPRPRLRLVKPNTPPNSNPNQKRIDELRRRLKEINESDDWADTCGGRRFEIEREIYNLEHAGETPEEWPDDAITVKD